MSRDAEFNIIDLRYNTLDFYFFVFKEQGTQYIRFVGADADATCEFYGGDISGLYRRIQGSNARMHSLLAHLK